MVVSVTVKKLDITLLSLCIATAASTSLLVFSLMFSLYIFSVCPNGVLSQHYWLGRQICKNVVSKMALSSEMDGKPYSS